MRIEAIEKPKGLMSQAVYWMSRRRLGKVVEPLMVTARHPRLLRAYIHMELGQEAAKSVNKQLKDLCQIKVAMMVGCPF